MIDTRAAFAIVLRQFYLVRGSAPRIIQLFIWVAIDMVLWGFMARYLNSFDGARYNFVTVLLGAVFLWDIMIRILQGTTMGYMEDSWSRNHFNVFVSPISVGSYLTGLVLSSIMTSTVTIIVMTILAAGLFGLSILSFGMALFPFLMILFLFGITLGIIGCALMLRMGPSAEWLVWPIPFVVSPFAGVFYPLSTLPPWMQDISKGVPVSYVFENIRSITANGTLSAPDMITGLSLGVLYLLMACGIFAIVFRRALRTGAIARYGAENF